MLYTSLRQQPFIIVGPCVIESPDIMAQIASQVQAWQRDFPFFRFIFKASFDKANRTSLSSYRGQGMEAGLAVLADIRTNYGLPILTDIHESWQAESVGKVVDILQIPAFLCRQTDLLLAAAATQKIVNIKKAQFLSAADMRHVIEKMKQGGNEQILLTERGTMFGYNNLVVDYTGVAELMDFGYPVVMDATHAVQKPGAAGGKSGGNGHYAPLLARAAAAVGVKAFFLETHPQPSQALSDGPNMIPLDIVPKLLQDLQALCSIDWKT